MIKSFFHFLIFIFLVFTFFIFALSAGWIKIVIDVQEIKQDISNAGKSLFMSEHSINNSKEVFFHE